MKQCPQCRTANADTANFCANCGYSATAQNQPPSVVPIKKNKLLLPLGIIGGVIGLCALCGVVGNLVDKNKASQTSVATTNPTNTTGTSNPTTSTNIATPVVDIPKLIHQPPEVFEKSFGKATEIVQITKNDYGTAPGEFRDYKVPGAGKYSTKNGMMVRFYKGKAVLIMVDLPTPASSAETALSQVNIDVKGISPTFESVLAHRWQNQNLNGITFKDVAAFKIGADGKNFTTMQAEVEQ
jgi:hypothetical protein